MTKHYEEYLETVIQTKRRYVNTTCDNCGEEISYAGMYNTREFNLEFTKGTSYPEEGGHKIGWAVEDLCDTCVEWLKNILLKNDVIICKVDIDW